MTGISLGDVRARIAALALPEGVDAVVVARDAASIAAAALVADGQDLLLLPYRIEDGLAACDDLEAGQRVVVLAPAAHQRALGLLVERAGAELLATLELPS
jgi:hypothetical protein